MALVSGLRELAAQATPGPWTTEELAPASSAWLIRAGTPHVAKAWAAADARLVALAPEMAALLADMADALQRLDDNKGLEMTSVAALLARYAALNQKAAQ